MQLHIFLNQLHVYQLNYKTTELEKILGLTNKNFTINRSTHTHTHTHTHIYIYIYILQLMIITLWLSSHYT